jgi:hypothetical protein
LDRDFLFRTFMSIVAFNKEIAVLDPANIKDDEHIACAGGTPQEA